MGRLVLIDTVDALPGLLPLHAWTALMSTELVLIARDDHPFRDHLDAAGLRVEVLDDPSGAADAALSRTDLLSGLSPAMKGLATHVVDRVREVGEAAYLFGPTDGEAFTRTLGMEAARAQIEVEIVYFSARPKGTEVLRLVEIQERLRAPDGCPWDREQDHQSLIRYAVEEVHELAEAIAHGDADDVREELGDLLLQVVFHAQIAEDRGQESDSGGRAGSFTIDEVAKGIADKLVRRHPHVFGDETAADAGSVMERWDELKAAEKPERSGPFEGVPAGQPAISYAEQLQRKAAKLGIGVVEADAGALRGALDSASTAPADEAVDAIGELLFGVVALARDRGVDPEQALRAAVRRFRAYAEERAADAAE